MIKVSAEFPRLTGNDHDDLKILFDYIYKLERELRFELSLANKKIKELENGNT